MKYRMVREPFSVSGVLGASAAGSDSLYTVGFYPMLLAGSEHFYVGGKAILFSAHVGDIVEDVNSTMHGLVVGASLGQRMRFLPEPNLHFGGAKVLPVLGVGFQYNLSQGSPDADELRRVAPTGQPLRHERASNSAVGQCGHSSKEMSHHEDARCVCRRPRTAGSRVQWS